MISASLGIKKFPLTSFLRGQAAVRKVLWRKGLGRIPLALISCHLSGWVPNGRFTAESL